MPTFPGGLSISILLAQNKNSSCFFMWGTYYRCRCKHSIFRVGRFFSRQQCCRL